VAEETREGVQPNRLPSPNERSSFRARQAFLTLLVYVGIQWILPFFGVFFLTVPLKKVISPDAIIVLATGVASLASAGATIGIIRTWAMDLVHDKSSSGLGLVHPSIRSLVTWGLLGAVIGAAYVAFTLSSKRASSGEHPGRAAWALVPLLVSSATEEVVFRGLLLRGFAASWGFLKASIVSTFCFAAMYLLVTIFDWPQTIALSVMAVAALAARLYSGSLYCSLTFRLIFALFMGAIPFFR